MVWSWVVAELAHAGCRIEEEVTSGGDDVVLSSTIAHPSFGEVGLSTLENLYVRLPVFVAEGAAPPRNATLHVTFDDGSTQLLAMDEPAREVALASGERGLVYSLLIGSVGLDQLARSPIRSMAVPLASLVVSADHPSMKRMPGQVRRLARCWQRQLGAARRDAWGEAPGGEGGVRGAFRDLHGLLAAGHPDLAARLVTASTREHFEQLVADALGLGRDAVLEHGLAYAASIVALRHRYARDELASFRGAAFANLAGHVLQVTASGPELRDVRPTEEGAVGMQGDRAVRFELDDDGRWRVDARPEPGGATTEAELLVAVGAILERVGEDAVDADTLSGLLGGPRPLDPR